MKGVAVFIILALVIPLAYSISIKELIAKYSFSAITPQFNITSHADFMTDANNNGINDTLVIELEAKNSVGTFVFVVNLLDKNGILTNETNRTLPAGTNKVNITFSSLLLSQEQFNYSVKVYNSSRRQKFRKDFILTQIYQNYEEGFRIVGIKDSQAEKTLRINSTINSPKNETHITAIFLNYANQSIFLKTSKTFRQGTNHIIFDFDNESIKRTHYTGNFSVPSIKIGRKTHRTDFTTASYDFRDFAASPYIFNFTDNGLDLNGNGKYDFLGIDADVNALKAGNYVLTAALYDLFGALLETKNTSVGLGTGNSIIPIRFNGTGINEKRLNGPFIVKYAELYEKGIMVDRINDAYTTKSYNFNDFDSPDLPDLAVNISVSDEYRHGIGNITINFTFINRGSKHAFNVVADVFDNATFSKSNKSNILNANSKITYQFYFENISDFEITAIADLQGLVEESNESNNAEKVIIKLNKKPVLAPISDMTANETGKIIVNLSAFDPNGDELAFSLNSSKFLANSTIFQWATSTTDSGNYTISATASDGFLNDTLLFRVIVLDAPEKDFDNDGIEDSIDKVIGDESSVNTSTINLTVLLDNSRNLSKLPNQSAKIKLIDNNLTIAEFELNLSLTKLNLWNITVNKQAGNATGSLIIRGVKMPQGTTKSLYVDRLNQEFNGICIKEDEISSISQISASCSLNSEFKVECDGTLQGSYICAYNSTINKYKVNGLKHSGIIQLDYKKPPVDTPSASAASSSGSGSGGGGGIICVSNWQCNEWSQCIDSFRNRKCIDMNKCAFPGRKPLESKQCAVDATRESVSGITGLPSYADKVQRAGNGGISTRFTGITGNVVKLKSSLNDFNLIDYFSIILVLMMAYVVFAALFLKTFK
ncbi:hypothetical protein HYY71_01490 [Candidatus Woesearchaeota archaeon]|nr:hypothetical protein [Candidatus Woesearchaeota archaeon]